MLDLIFQIGASLLGGALLGAGIGYLLSQYLDRAKEWFDRAWRQISRISRAVGILVRRGNRLFKVFVTQFFNGEVESYEEEGDKGVEIDWDDLSDEAKEALSEDEFIPVSRYEL